MLFHLRQVRFLFQQLFPRQVGVAPKVAARGLCGLGRTSLGRLARQPEKPQSRYRMTGSPDPVIGCYELDHQRRCRYGWLPHVGHVRLEGQGARGRFGRRAL